MSQFILAIDQGTSSSRAIVFDEAGSVRGVAQAAVESTFPHPGWVNQDSSVIWRVTLETTKKAIQRAGIAPSKIAGIGIANQRETTILWDRKTGKPVAPAIIWQSRQSAPLVDAIRERAMAGAYQARTGLVPDAYFSATKIAWLLDSDRELRRRAEAGELCFGTVDSWLMWNLSGGAMHLTDVSNASRTMLFDIHLMTWSQELLDDLAIPRAILPEVVDNSILHFETDPDVLGAAIRVCGSAGDQQAALYGQACFQAGEAKNTYGTGSFLLMNTGEQAIVSRSNLLSTVAWRIASRTRFALEGAIFVTGSAVQWLRDGLGIIRESRDVESLAASVPDSGGVSFVPALAGLGAPYWDQDARGTITGITRGTTAAHFARATLEGIAFQTKDVVDAMVKDSGVALAELRVDGGAVENSLLMQVQADILGVPVVVPENTESTALGAAYLAGLASGIWTSENEIRVLWQERRRFEPAISARDREARYERWTDAVRRALTK